MTKHNNKKRTSATKDLTLYRGPIVLPTNDGLDNRTTKVNVSRWATMSSSPAGVAAYSVSSDPGSCSDWTSLAAVYQEWRCVGFQVKYVPFYKYAQVGGIGPSVGAVCNVHTPAAAAPASLDAVLQNATHKSVHSHTPWTMHWRMHSIEEAVWTTTSAATDHGSIQWYLNQMTSSSDYGLVHITYLIEFRGRK